jgi:hypothetical protein
MIGFAKTVRQPRAVHTDLAFQNLDRQRRGSQVLADQVPVTQEVRSGMRWREEVLGELSEMFEVRRLDLHPDSGAREFVKAFVG